MQKRLYQPLRIGPREARNRIVFGSHTTNLARQNRLSQQHADYYAARASGGAAIIILEEHIVHPSDSPYARALLGYLPETSAAIATVAQSIHAHSSLALVQLNHNGQQSISDYHQQEIWAPSAIPDVSSREVPKAMEQADITAVIDGFALVARSAKQAQADGVELQISDRSLLRQFLSPLTNQRTDQYGGSLENRLRFVQETLEAVGADLSRPGGVGRDCILGVRFCADEMAPWAGITPEQGIEIARSLTATGRIDYLTVTMGSIFSSHMFPFHASMHTPPGYATHLAAAMKAALPSIPIFAAGRITTATHAEHILAEQQADGVEMIRPLIADPDLPRLSQANQETEVRPCLFCNQGCQVRNTMNLSLACTVNPDVIRVQNYASLVGADLSRPSAPSLLIIGGGPAGMEAARTATLRGHRVVLYEREEQLGGTVRLAAKGAGRSELQFITDYLAAQLKKLNVEIHLGMEVTAEFVLAQQPASVLVATGSRPGHGLLPISGQDLPHVTDILRILQGEPVTGPRVVIIDETASHGVLSVAELLATQGHSVEVITEDWFVGRDLASTQDIVPWMQRVLAIGLPGLIMTTHTTVVRIETGQVIVIDRFAAGERAITADTIVLGLYEQPNQELYYALKGRVPRLYRAGDCIAARRIQHAIAEGRLIGEQC